MFIPGVDRCDLASVDTSIDAGYLSQALTKLLLSEEMAFGCATKPRRPGVKKNWSPKSFMPSDVSVVCLCTYTKPLYAV